MQQGYGEEALSAIDKNHRVKQLRGDDNTIVTAGAALQAIALDRHLVSHACIGNGPTGAGAQQLLDNTQVTLCCCFHQGSVAITILSLSRGRKYEPISPRCTDNARRNSTAGQIHGLSTARQLLLPPLEAGLSS